MRHKLAATAALLIVSCSSQSDGNKAEEAKGDGGAGGAPGAVALQPGQWESTVEVLRMEIPNLPKGMAPPNQSAVTTSMCLTP